MREETNSNNYQKDFEIIQKRKLDKASEYKFVKFDDQNLHILQRKYLTRMFGTERYTKSQQRSESLTLLQSLLIKSTFKKFLNNLYYSVFLMNAEENKAVIIDSGSYSIKAGLQFQEFPSICMPNLIGFLKYPPNVLSTTLPKDYYVGDEVNQKRGILNINQPIPNGIIENWGNIEKVWEFIFFNQIRVDPSQQPLVLVQSQRHSKQDRCRIAEIIFEKLSVPEFYLANQFSLPLWHQSSQMKMEKIMNGLVVSSGYRSTHIVPIINSNIIQHAIVSLQFGGKDIDEYFCNVFQQYKFELSFEKRIAQNIKERLFYVCQNFQKQKSKKINPYQDLVGKDGQMIGIGDQRFESCQIMFNPQLAYEAKMKISKGMIGIHEAIISSIMNTDESFHKQLMNNIVLSGGNTLFKGLQNRLKRQISSYYEKQTKQNLINVKIYAPQQRKFSAYLGAKSMIPFLRSNKMWINKKQYEEKGDKILINQ